MIEKNHVIHDIVAKIKAKNYPIIWGACDSSGKKIDQTSGLNVHMQLQRGLGLKVHTHKFEKLDSKRQAQTEFYNGRLFVDPLKCPKLTEMFNNYEWAGDGTFPHDEYSHIHDALTYLVINWLKKGIKPNPGITIRDRSAFGIR
jgi:hypothetical protein